MDIRNESVLVLDFGGQYAQLIARKVRDNNVYCEVRSYKTPANEIKEKNYKGIIFTGGINNITAKEPLNWDKEILNLSIPILSLSYGSNILIDALNGETIVNDKKEKESINVNFNINSKLFKDLNKSSKCWISNKYKISKVPANFNTIATTENSTVTGIENTNTNMYALMFQPEVSKTEQGKNIIKNFLYNICDCSGDWKISSFVEKTIKDLKTKIGNKRVLVGLSGGVDSSVAAVLVHRAIGKNLTCIFVDHGLLRKNEGDDVEKVFKKQFDMNIIRVNAEERFLNKLEGVVDPEKKRKIIGEEFIRVFEEEAKKLGSVEFLCQGTIYPDVVESGEGDSAVIKSHHNVGGLPEDIGFEGIVEPLRDLFKDEVRQAGLELDIPEPLVWRQPFPGPGLAIRVMGDITKEKLDILRDADAIFREEIANAKLDKEIHQYFAVYTGVRSVGVTDDDRTYDTAIALRGVTTDDFMTAEWAKIPYDVLSISSERIIKEVKGVNRIVYDITSKPPSTIEWE